MTFVPTLKDALLAEQEQIQLLQAIAAYAKAINHIQNERFQNQQKTQSDQRGERPDQSDLSSTSFIPNGSQQSKQQRQIHAQHDSPINNGTLHRARMVTKPNIIADGDKKQEAKLDVPNNTLKQEAASILNLESRETDVVLVSDLHVDNQHTITESKAGTSGRSVHQESASYNPPEILKTGLHNDGDSMLSDISNNRAASTRIVQVKNKGQNQPVERNHQGQETAMQVKTTHVHHGIRSYKDTSPGGSVIDVIEIMDSPKDSTEIDGSLGEPHGESNSLGQEISNEVQRVPIEVHQIGDSMPYSAGYVSETSMDDHMDSQDMESVHFDDDEDKMYIENNVLDQEIVQEVINMGASAQTLWDDSEEADGTEPQQMTSYLRRKSIPLKPSLYVRGGRSRTYAGKMNGKRPIKGWLRRRR